MRAVAYASAYWAMTKNEDEEKVRQYQRNIGVLMASTLERSVIITNLSRKATQQHLIDFFTFCGGIESLVIEEGSPFNTAIVDR
jgi:RNA recognition motif-containing protein